LFPAHRHGLPRPRESHHHAMRILNVIDTLDPARGGTVSSLLQATSLLEERGHEAHIAALADTMESPWIPANPHRVFCFGPARGKFSFTASYSSWLRNAALHYDLVVIRGLWQYQGIGTAREMWRLRRPYAIFIHGMLGPAALKPGWKHLKKAAYWSLFEGRVVARAAAAVFTSDEERRLARGFTRGSRWHPMVIENSVDAVPAPSRDDVDALLTRYPRLRGGRVVLALGRLHPVKGCDDLIRAFARAFTSDEQACLVLAGPVEDAQYAHRLQILAREAGVADRIVWPGLVGAREKAALFSLATVFVSSSHHENFGFAAVEALASGLPVIVTNKVNVHRILDDAGAGIVCGDDETGLAEALRKWTRLGGSELEALKRRQLDLWKRRFSRESAGRHLEESLLGLAAAK
jgi:glycosyltransferase involved in cell wall biosynthesis